MKITVITPITTGKYKDDTMVFCEAFEELGHEVNRLTLWSENGIIRGLKGESLNIDNAKDSDVIWAPFEPLIPCALWLREIFKIPVAGHFEVVPINRIKLDEADELFCSTITNIPETFNRYHEYKKYGNAFELCNAKTYTCTYHKQRIHKLTGKKVEEKNLFLRPYALDVKMLESYKMKVKKKNQICSICRLIPHKKIHHIIKALSILKDRPNYVVVGKGVIEEGLKKLATELNVNVEFKGLVSDEERSKIIQESLFCVYPWAWLPVGEAAYYKVPSIVYDEPDTRERLKKMPVYTTANDTEQLARSINHLYNNKALTQYLGDRANREIMNNKTLTFPSHVAAEKMIKVFEAAIGDYNDTSV